MTAMSVTFGHATVETRKSRIVRDGDEPRVIRNQASRSTARRGVIADQTADLRIRIR